MFQPGISGNTRGRPKGSLGGRAQALAALDRMLSKECNQQALFDALEKEFQADPARFFRNVVVPLIPRSTREALPPDANDDWLPMDRTPPSGPPPVLEPYVPPPPRSYPPPPVKGSFSEIQGLQPSVVRPQLSVFSPLSSFLMSALRPPASVLNLPLPSPRLSFTCYLLLLIPFALKPDPMPLPRFMHSRTLELAHVRTSPPASERLSRTVCAARVSVKGPAIRDPGLCQPAPKEPCRLRTNGSGPVLLSTACPLQTLKRPHVSHSRNSPVYPCYSLLLIPCPPCSVRPAAFLLQPLLNVSFKPFQVAVLLRPPSVSPSPECGSTALAWVGIG